MTIFQRWFGARPPAARRTALRSTLLLLAAFAPGGLRAQTTYTPYAFTTLAGKASTGSEDGPGATARFFGPDDVAVDRAGNLYVADTGNHTIRKVAPDGTVTTLAGFAGAAGAADGTGTAARFNSPAGIAVDAFGTVYVADTGNATIRKITPAGVVTTLAGTAGSSGSTDGIGTAAGFSFAAGVAVDSAGNVWVAEWGAHALRKITPSGVVSTMAALTAPPGESTSFWLGGLAIDAADNLLIGDLWDDRVCKITPAGTLTTLRLADGTVAFFDVAEYLAVDGGGNVYVTDPVRRNVQRLSAAGDLTTYVTLPPVVPLPEGMPVTLAGVAVDTLGRVYIADQAYSAILRVGSGGTLITLAGAGPAFGATDASGAAARFFFPAGLAVDATGNVYLADSANDTIRKLTPGGAVTTLAGLALSAGSADGTGSAARFNNPTAVAVDSGGNVYVADTGNFTLRKITPAGVVTTLAGLAGAAAVVDGTGTAARFGMPQSLALDGAGNVYVADIDHRVVFPRQVDNAKIRKVSGAGAVTTFADLGSGVGLRTPPPTTVSLAFDRAGHLDVAISGAGTVSQVAPDGTVTVLAGAEGTGGGDSVDGTGAAARFSAPSGLATDAAGNLYLTDHQAIRRITPAGVVTTLAGVSGVTGSTDGAGSAARFNDPTGIAVDGAGRIYVADTDSQTIRVGIVAGPPVIVTQPQGQSVASGATAQFSVTVSGVPEPTLQWFRNGAVISGACGGTLSLAGVLASDAADYTVTATNALGSVTSSKATLTVMAAGGSGSGTASAGGGGAMAGWFVFALALLAIGRWADGGALVRRREWALRDRNRDL